MVTRTDLTRKATKEISGAMNGILADVFALYLKTKNFHWHLSGPHFRDYHLMLDATLTDAVGRVGPIMALHRTRRVRRFFVGTSVAAGPVSLAVGA